MPDRHAHRAVGRIDAILDVVARAPEPPTMTAIATRLDLPRSTTADLLRELVAHGYLRVSGGGHRLGLRLHVLGVVAGGPVPPVDHPRLESLARVARTPVVLGVLVGGQVLYLDSAGPRAPERLQAVADDHLPRPALRTAAGRLLLACADERDRTAVLRSLVDVDPEAVAAFDRERPAIAHTRLARSDGLADPAVRAVAVPVVENGSVVAAVVLLGPRRATTAVDLALDRAAARVLEALAGNARAGQDRRVTSAPTPFEEYAPGVLLHGTAADLAVGDLLVPGRPTHFEAGRVMNHVYVTATLDAATWGAEMAVALTPGATRGHIFLVEPTGTLEDDPNVTDKKLPGNPTRSYRTREPVRIVGELTDWVGHPPEQVQAMLDGLADLRRRGEAVIYD